jgi:E3 ubiquitin-protein ligase Hakai
MTATVDENLDTESLTTHAIASFVSPGAQPLHRNEALNWKYKVNLIGEKVVNPRIHCCDKCLLPILVYGRMVCIVFIHCYLFLVSDSVRNRTYRVFYLYC